MPRAVQDQTTLSSGLITNEDGCGIRTKRQPLIGTQAVETKVSWQLRWPDGEIADIATIMNGSPTPILRVAFQGCDGSCPTAETTATATTPASGIVEFTPPSVVMDVPGIYQFSVGLSKADKIVFSSSGLMSVEPSPWSGTTCGRYGPPTLGEIRTHLRDRPGENDLLADVEFDDLEILTAVVRPVEEFNETPPTLCRYNCTNFPWRFAWRQGIVAELMRTAAHHYLRNKLQASSQGLSVDEKNKNDEYLRFSQLYREEWRRFLAHKKAEINSRQFYGSIEGVV